MTDIHHDNDIGQTNHDHAPEGTLDTHGQQPDGHGDTDFVPDFDQSSDTHSQEEQDKILEEFEKYSEAKCEKKLVDREIKALKHDLKEMNLSKQEEQDIKKQIKAKQEESAKLKEQMSLHQGANHTLKNQYIQHVQKEYNDALTHKKFINEEIKLVKYEEMYGKITKEEAANQLKELKKEKDQTISNIKDAKAELKKLGFYQSQAVTLKDFYQLNVGKIWKSLKGKVKKIW